MAGDNLGSVPTATTTDQDASAQSLPSNESGANDSIIVPDDKMPKRASFMGIPPEMRLRIYDFLLNGSRITDLKTPYGLPHSCYVDSRFEGPEEQLKCRCARPVHPQILAVNHLVFEEAFNVMYGTTELRLRLPECGEIHATLPKIPVHGKEKVTKIVFLSTFTALDIKLFDEETPSNAISLLLHRLSLDYPSLKHVRLLIDLNAIGFHRFTPDFAPIAAILRLPQIESLNVELLRRSGLCVIAQKFASGLDASLRAEMAALGKNVKIMSWGKEEEIGRRTDEDDGKKALHIGFGWDGFRKAEDLLVRCCGTIGSLELSGGRDPERYTLLDEMMLPWPHGEQPAA
ncbi:uncharacterized protein MYCFIDRAFT_179485 [Pseudocercospora fijiensis CIRAD86]|uniref:F-box domain-containing protein n=1 Tax=Pseudocercospora fijiensis (strain CIRAD86) TaxID=383855 RepID=M2YJV1_PSEFD|nr:uncharacterized protein MYCFIDRAFT_179485 [Pseudocercospora fijiensis CIRAD86]EME78035.1 hypothetical protein MYCFIDRAFT_179485 [Pseudocercospora fijiensis CIRAD86]